MRQFLWWRGAAGRICCLTVLISLRAVVAAPSIDGFTDDEFWQHSAREWHVASTDDPTRRATFYLGYDQEYLYVAADVSDQDVQGTRRGSKSKVWLDDAFEVFIDFGDGRAEDRTPQSYEYGFSVAGGVNWTRGIGDGSGRNYPAHGWPNAWNSSLSSALSLKPGTTLNASGDEDEGYRIEAAIPWSELGLTSPILPLRTIGVNFMCLSPPPGGGLDPDPLSTTPGITLENNHKPGLWERMRLDWMAPWPVRGVAVDLPALPGDEDPDAIWLDRNAWMARLDSLETYQINRILLMPRVSSAMAGHPEQSVAGHPELSEGSRLDELLWLVEQANVANIDVYLLLNPSTGGTAPPDWEQLDTLIQLLPGLQGVVARVGEDAWSVQDIEDTVLDVLEAGAGDDSAPRLMCWSRGVAAGEMIRLRTSYPALEVMLDVQDDGLWIKPIIDPLVSEYASAMSSAGQGGPEPWRPVVIGGPGIAYEHLGWGDPRWMWDMAAHVRRYGLDGMVLHVAEDGWPILEEAFAAYAVHSATGYNRSRWIKRLEEIYGTGEFAGQLLEAMEHASAIMPTFMHLVIGAPDRFAPQYGLLLVHYLELPTFSDYLDQRRVRQEGMPWLWPRARWGDPVAGIHDYVDRQAARIASRPDSLTNDIGRHVDAIRGLLRNLRANPPADEEQAAKLDLLLDQIELTAHLGRHEHHKLRAAIGWKRFISGRENHLTCLRGLRESLEAWRDAVGVAERLEPGEVTFWQSQPVDVPPWTAGQIERSYRRVQGHWRDQLRRFERELALVQSAASAGRESARLPLWDHVNAIPNSDVRVTQQIGFEVPRDNRFRLTEFGTLTTEPDLVLGETTSLLADARSADGDGWYVAMMSDPGHCPLLSHRAHQITFSYRVVAAPQTQEPVFMVGVRPAAGRAADPTALDLAEIDGDHPAWSAPSDHRGSRVIQIPPSPSANGQLFVAVRSGAALVIDQLGIHVIIDYKDVSKP